MPLQLDTSESDKPAPSLAGVWGVGVRQRQMREGRTDSTVAFCLCTWVTMNELTHAESRRSVYNARHLDEN